jgi:hypothetical protein
VPAPVVEGAEEAFGPGGRGIFGAFRFDAFLEEARETEPLLC